MFSIKNLVCGWNGGSVIGGIDFDAGSGELVAVLGANGSGKSTLLKAVVGLCEVTRGEIMLDGISLRGLPTHELVRLGVGFVPQGRPVFDDLTVAENLVVSSDAAGVAFDEEFLLGFFPELRGLLARRAWELSGGQKQLLAMASALAPRPKLLLLDEPTLGLSPVAAKRVYRVLRQLTACGVTIALVEQNVAGALENCDRAIVLSQGRVVLRGGRELLGSNALRQAFLGA